MSARCATASRGRRGRPAAAARQRMQGLPRPVWHRSRRHASAAIRARPARSVPAVPVLSAAPFASVPVASAPPLPPLRHVATADRAARRFALLRRGASVCACCRSGAKHSCGSGVLSPCGDAIARLSPSGALACCGCEAAAGCIGSVAHCAAAVPHRPRTAAPGTVPLGVHARHQKAPSPAPRSPAVQADPAAPIAVPAPMRHSAFLCCGRCLYRLFGLPRRFCTDAFRTARPRFAAGAAIDGRSAVAVAGVRVAATGAVRAANWPVAARSRPTRSAGALIGHRRHGAHGCRRTFPEKECHKTLCLHLPDDVVPAHSKVQFKSSCKRRHDARQDDVPCFSRKLSCTNPNAVRPSSAYRMI